MFDGEDNTVCGDVSFPLPAVVCVFACRFLIGREKDGVESEVARLINESLEMDKTKSKNVNFIKNGQSNSQMIF